MIEKILWLVEKLLANKKLFVIIFLLEFFLFSFKTDALNKAIL